MMKVPDAVSITTAQYVGYFVVQNETSNCRLEEGKVAGLVR